MSTLDVTFIYAGPFDADRRQLFKNKDMDATYPSVDDVLETIPRWRILWQDTNKNGRVIEKLTEITHRRPKRALECFVFSGGMSPMSTPFLLPITYAHNRELRTDEDFIQTMVHELIHIFVSDDTENYWTMVREKYAEEAPTTQNHILIFALLAKAYQDLFGHMPPDFSRDDLPDGYAQAMCIVKTVGYEKIVAEYDALALR